MVKTTPVNGQGAEHLPGAGHGGQKCYQCMSCNEHGTPASTRGHQQQKNATGIATEKCPFGTYFKNSETIYKFIFILKFRKT